MKRYRRAHTLLKTLGDAARARGQGRMVCAQFWVFIGGLIWFAFAAPKSGAEALLTPVLFFSLAILSTYDLRYFIIPDLQIFILFLGGVIATFVVAPDEAFLRITTAAATFVFFWGVSVIYSLARGREGLGFGDVKLFGVGMLWIEPLHLPLWLALACASAFLSFLVQIPSQLDIKRAAERSVAFGPHLALGLWLIWLIS